MAGIAGPREDQSGLLDVSRLGGLEAAVADHSRGAAFLIASGVTVAPMDKTFKLIGGNGKQYVLYQDPDHGFVIDGLVRGHHHKAPAHDHAHTWTAYGIVSGWERMTRYVRKDDGGDPTRADIELVSSEICEAGTVDIVPPWDIHTESNDENRAVALSVRSETLGDFDQNIFREDGTLGTIRGLDRVPFPLR